MKVYLNLSPTSLARAFVTAALCAGVAAPAIGAGSTAAVNGSGAISGRVVDAVSRMPVANGATVRLFDATGNLVAASSRPAADYEFGSLAAGTYYLYATSPYMQAALYDELPCPGGPPAGCSVTSGTPLTLSLDGALTGVDIALRPLGSIVGTVTDGTTGALASGVSIDVWDAAGRFVAGSCCTASYDVRGVPPGTYFVTAHGTGYRAEVYPNVPCSGTSPSTCTLASGTPVSVAEGAATSGVDFVLDRVGGLDGDVIDAASGAAIGSARIDVYDASGALVESTVSAGNGTFEALGLQGGRYFVVAAAPGYNGVLYDGNPCPSGRCEPTTGTPIDVPSSTTLVGGVELFLQPFDLFVNGFEPADAPWTTGSQP